MLFLMYLHICTSELLHTRNITLEAVHTYVYMHTHIFTYKHTYIYIYSISILRLGKLMRYTTMILLRINTF